MTSHRHPAISTTSHLETLTIDDALVRLSENAPPISPWSPGIRRIRSYGSKSTFLPKRPTKARLSKPFSKPQVASFYCYPAAKPGSFSFDNARNEEHELDGDDEELHLSHAVADSNLTLALSSCQADDTSAAQSALKDSMKQHPPWRLPPFLPSKFNLILSSTPALRLENSGSVARDHLASERTFLAYMRTSLAIASSGVVLVQLFTVATVSSQKNTLSPYARKIHAYIRLLGAITIIMGLFVLATGVMRYFTVQTALTKGSFPAARITVGAIALALTVLVILTFGVLLSENLDSRGLLGF